MVFLVMIRRPSVLASLSQTASMTARPAASVCL
jgi:hypothetical protein